MNFHFHNKCRPTTCFKHYNAHKFILFTVYPPSTFLVHTVSIYPSAIWCHFCLTWGIRVINHIGHFAPTMNCWGLYMGLGYCMEAETSQHVLALSLPYYYRLKTSPGQGHYSVCPSRVGISGSESQYSRQCPHFHLLCVRRMWEMEMRVMPVAWKRPGMGLWPHQLCHTMTQLLLV